MDNWHLQNTRLTNLEYLGADMVEGGNEFGAGTPYGAALIRVGQTQQALGETERNFIRNGGYCQFQSLLQASPLTVTVLGQQKVSL